MQSNGLDSSAQPSNLQDSWSNMANLSYLKPLTEQLSFDAKLCIFSYALHRGCNTGRQDYLHNLGFNLAYAFNEWVNFSMLSNYTWKFSDDANVPEYEDFIGGIVAGFNFSF